MTFVKNVIGPSRFSVPRGYTSWLDYWEKHTGMKGLMCGVEGCISFYDLVGAHVQKVNSTDKRYYITPLCSNCNNRIGVFTVTTPLVPVPSNL